LGCPVRPIRLILAHISGGWPYFCELMALVYSILVVPLRVQVGKNLAGAGFSWRRRSLNLPESSPSPLSTKPAFELCFSA
jgi:hypothetical protein